MQKEKQYRIGEKLCINQNIEEINQNMFDIRTLKLNYEKRVDKSYWEVFL